MRRNYVLVLMAVLVVLLLGCGKSPSNETAEKPATAMPGYAASGTPSTRAATPGATKAGEKPAIASATTVPVGEHIVIRLGETISSKRNNSGDSFSGTVAEPISVNGRVVIPQGATAAGTVTEAKPLGRFKGGAVLRIVLNSINVNGKNYNGQMIALNYLSDEDIANVLTYVRNSFGNSGDAVNVAEVRRIRSEAPPPAANPFE